tara:strand:- start:880 stop:987 length:108 start_codon:yes stop_codon:yes gene_type:complete
VLANFEFWKPNPVAVAGELRLKHGEKSPFSPTPPS